MIEIEVEMDSDVLAAEAASNAVCENLLLSTFLAALIYLIISDSIILTCRRVLLNKYSR